MGHTGERLEATAQIERVRSKLGEALGQTQDIQQAGLDIEQVSAALARSVKELFSLQKLGVNNRESVKYVDRAMRYLRQTLVLLQEVPGDNPALSKTTSTVAHTIALLYPVAKITEKISGAQPRGSKAPASPAGPAPLPLTQPSSKVNVAPVPLTKRKRRATGPGDHDRRIASRRAIDVDIGIHSSTNFFTGFSHDISDGGLFIATFDVLEIGTRLNVNFSIPSKRGPVLSIDGTVKWTREYNETNPEIEPGMGIEFEDLDSPARDAINDFIAKNPPMFFEHE